jgi:hypothetical protein
MASSLMITSPSFPMALIYLGAGAGLTVPLQELDPNVNCGLGPIDLLSSKRSSLKGAS